MIPAKYAHFAFGFFLSMIMSWIISGVSTLAATGGTGWIPIWFEAWLFSWAIAFPSVLIVAPIARRIVARLTAPPG